MFEILFSTFLRLFTGRIDSTSYNDNSKQILKATVANLVSLKLQQLKNSNVNLTGI